MNGFRDSAIERLWLGIILPAGLVVLVLFNLIAGRVYWPAGRSGVPPEQRVFIFQFFEDGWHVTGTVLMKLGLAAGLFAWFYLANDGRMERWVFPSVIASIAVMATGLFIHLFGFF